MVQKYNPSSNSGVQCEAALRSENDKICFRKVWKSQVLNMKLIESALRARMEFKEIFEKREVLYL